MTASDQGQPIDVEFCRALVEQCPAGLIASDGSLTIRSCNAAAAELFGRSMETMRGTPMADLAGPRQRTAFRKVLEQTLDDGRRREFEIRQRDRVGQETVLLAILGPVPGPDGAPTGMAAWVRDISHRRRINDRLVQAEKMASLGTLASGVAHHFNNILGGVATYVDYALTSNEPNATRRALQMTADAVSRVSKLTQSLLSFAEQDSRRVDLADLTEVVLTFVHLVERPLGERKIKLVLDRREIPILAVEANRMHHVLGNLLTNAEEAMPDGGELHLTLDADEEWVWLDFADTGCGIKAEHLPMVFEPFFTTKGLLAGGDGGNPGLGLSVVHGIVLEMGGDISVTSKEGRGACFRIRFRRSQDELK